MSPARGLAALGTACLLLLTGCGGSSSSATTDTDTSSPSAVASNPSASSTVVTTTSPSAATSSSATDSASASASPPVCEPPTAGKVSYTGGSATLTIADGPDAGTYQLDETSDTFDESYLSHKGHVYDLQGYFQQGQVELNFFAEVKGLCQPVSGGFVVSLPGGLAYAAPSECAPVVTTLDATSVAGTFTCPDLQQREGPKSSQKTISVDGVFMMSR